MGYELTQELIRDGRLVAWIRGDQRTVIDFSGQGNDGILTDGWYGGKGVQFANADGVITIADAPELQLAGPGTLFMTGGFYNIEREIGESYLISKMDAGGVNYDWRFDDTPQMEFNDGNNVRTLAHDYRGNKSLAVTFDGAGGIPNGWADGELVGAYSGVSTVTVNDAPLLIGNVFGLDRSMLNSMWNTLIVNDVMTADELLTLHRELLRIMRGSEP